MSVIYLGIDDVLGFYAERFGLSFRRVEDRLRDRNRLEAALGGPSRHAYDLGADLA